MNNAIINLADKSVSDDIFSCAARTRHAISVKGTVGWKLERGKGRV